MTHPRYTVVYRPTSGDGRPFRVMEIGSKVLLGRYTRHCYAEATATELNAQAPA